MNLDPSVFARIQFAQPDDELRDRMVDAIMPTWDGNETWLIVAGVALLAAFPIACGVLLPALYLPLIARLLALGLRGLCFEFRFQVVDRGRRRWDIVFGVGSIVAALAAGTMVGGLIQGVAVADGTRFNGSVFDIFRLFALFTALAVLSGAWLYLKATGALRTFSEWTLRLSTSLFVGSPLRYVLPLPSFSGGSCSLDGSSSAAHRDHGAVSGHLRRPYTRDRRARRGTTPGARPIRVWRCRPRCHDLSRHCAFPPWPLGCGVVDTQPCFPSGWRGNRDTGGACLFGLRLPGVPRQDAR